MTGHYVIRALGAGEVQLAIDWAAAEGWNPGHHDAACFHAADPGGFLLGSHDGEPAATISVVRYGPSFAFLGLYIATPAFRGRGLGYRLWQAGMDRLAGRVVGLDGVVEQQDNYRRSGFELAWRNVRYEGRARAAAAAPPQIVKLSTVPFEAVLGYDRAFFPADRTAFLRGWISQAGATALGWLEGGELRGYGVVRPCLVGSKVGPLFADSPAIAQGLFGALSSAAPAGTPLYLDVPEPNAEAVALAQRHAMSVVFETARMYTGAVGGVPMPRQYGITTFELG